MEKERQIKETNRITLAGTITRVEKTSKVVKLHLSTSPSRNKDYRSYPVVICTKGIAKKAESLNPHDHVEIECCQQSVPYSKRRSKTETAYFVATDVHRSESKLSEQLGIKNIKGAYDDKNEGIIVGEVARVSVISNDKDVLISISAKANNRVSIPTVGCFGMVARQVMKEQVKKGDIVAVSCFVKTGKDKHGNFRESLVAREFSLVERK